MTAPHDIHLWWHPGSCSRVTLVALEEIGVPFGLTVPRRPSAEYFAITPKGRVPSLVVDGVVLTETPAIQTYLGRTFPEARLLPTEPAAALDALSTMCWFSSNVHPPISRQRFPASVAPSPDCHEEVRLVARGILEDAFRILESRIAGREWLYGDWTIVDAYMLWLWFRAVGAGMDGTPFPRCADHAARCEERPSVARTLDREETELARIISERLIPEPPPYAAGRWPRTAVRRG